MSGKLCFRIRSFACFRGKDIYQVNSKYRRELTTTLEAQRTCCKKNYPLHGSKMNVCVCVCVCVSVCARTHTHKHSSYFREVGNFFATCPLGLQSCSQLSSVFRIYLVKIFAPKADISFSYFNLVLIEKR